MMGLRLELRGRRREKPVCSLLVWAVTEDTAHERVLPRGMPLGAAGAVGWGSVGRGSVEGRQV